MQTFTYTPYDDEHRELKGFQETGFYTVISQEQYNEALLKELLDFHKERFNEKIDQIETLFDAKKTEIEFIITQKTITCSELKQKIQNYTEKKSELKTEVEELNKIINGLQTKHDELRHELGKKQEEPVMKRIREAQEELKVLVEEYQKLLELKFPKNNTAVQGALTDHLNFLTDYKDGLKESYKKLKEKSEKQLLNGFGRLGSSMMIGAGITAATAGGWFFSIYVTENKFDNQNTLFFLLTGLFGLCEEFFKLGANSRLYGGFIMLAVFIGALYITTQVVRLTESWLRQASDEKSKQNFRYNIDSEKLFFNLKIDGGTFYTFWLQSLPWILVSGFVFIGIAIGNGGSNLNNLGAWLSGQMLGASIILLTGGFISLYYAKIIEPRYEKQNTQTNHWKVFIELFIAAILFLVAILFLITGEIIKFGSLTPPAVSALILFLTITILASFVIAYGVRLRDIYNNCYKTEKKILAIAKIIPVAANKIPLQLWYSETATFSDKLVTIEEELMDMIWLKAQWKPKKATLQSYIETRVGKIFKNNWLKVLNNKSRREQQIMPIDNFEKKYFPEISNQIESIQTSISNNQEKKTNLLHDIKELEEESSPYLRELKTEIEQLNAEVIEQTHQKTELEEKRYFDVTYLEKRRALAETEILKGYDLGRWWIKNNNNKLL